ncbi:hypothetical protein BCR35DRAFT_289370 [Leucosporidium creatinivorum]|uniref:Yeast cell wall synthesis Kre9/Knh1-like N-terminal domain-containing protein n=1 Tax=Leucosporidium creatinivorum TaxID=106004 RepID=A0A1Y2FVU3_9BASI|nr:hypothetical protein BCR35DRAFT_289370 [Leucosporidium creatinivorum]
MLKLSVLSTLALLVSSTTASIYTIKPTAKDSFKGGKSFTVTWTADSGDSATTTPLASKFGQTSVGIYTGSSSQQTLCQDLGIVDPSKVQELKITVDAKAGPDSSLYFIRYESLNNTDSTGTPLLAFSSRFTLTGMKGSFTSSEIAINSGISDDSLISATSASTDKVAATSLAVTKAAVATSSSASKSSGSLAQQTASTTIGAAGNGTETSAAGRVAVGAGAVVVAAAAFML